VAGELAARNYRFDEASSSRAAASRSIHQCARDGRPWLAPAAHRRRAGARVALEAAFKADPYSKLTMNQLT